MDGNATLLSRDSGSERSSPVAHPIVAIVGRPNVGKSSLFNWLVGRRISIVDPTAGVTRDRVSAHVSVADRHFELVDTGGIGIEDSDNLTEQVEHQIYLAIDQAALILFVVDTRAGITPLDLEVAERLRGVDKPILLVANKTDTDELATQSGEFFRLGFTDLVLVSAEQNRGKRELVLEILKRLPAGALVPKVPQAELHIAIVGRRNVGKSTFINALAEEERVIVSEVPGTTRDSIDVRFQRDGKTFVAIDTAGVRRKSKLANDIEFYSMNRAEKSIRRADVVLHLFDARLRVSRVDKQLTDYILQHHKPAIFVINKWDLAQDLIPTERYVKYFRAMFPMLHFVPIVFITAKEGRNVFRLLNLAQHLAKQAARRANTGELNKVIREAVLSNPPPVRLNRTPKIFYATQTGVSPPTIVLFTNGPELFDDAYRRYLLSYLRRHMPFREVPIQLILRARHGGGGTETSPPSRETIDEAPSSPSRNDTDTDAELLLPETSQEAPAMEDAPNPAPKPKAPRKGSGKSSSPGLWKDV